MKRQEIINHRPVFQTNLRRNEPNSKPWDDAMRQVAALIREGNDRLQDHHQQGIILLGNTGAGKTTLAHLLSGQRLQAIYDDQLDEYLVDAIQPTNQLTIGHQMASETTIPNKLLVGDTVIWDCPGFNDTDPAQEIANSFYIKRLFAITEQLKLVLVVPEADLRTSKGSNFLAVLNSCLQSFTKMTDSIALVVTQVTHSQTWSVTEQRVIFQNLLEKLLQDHPVTAEQKHLIVHFKEHALHLFHRPMKEGDLIVINPLKALKNNGQYLHTQDHAAKIVLSDKALAYSKQLLDTASDNFNQILATIVQAVTEVTECMTLDQSNILTQNAPLLQAWLPVAKQYPALVSPAHDQYFKSLELLTELQAVFHTDSVSSTTAGVALLQQAMTTLAQYTNDKSLQKLMQGYSYCLGQQHEYVQFFAAVCENSLPDGQAILPFLTNCHEQLSHHLHQQVMTLSLDLTKTEASYYLQALKHLNHYPESLACMPLKALAYTGLAEIAEASGHSQVSLDYYQQALACNRSLPSPVVYEKLGDWLAAKGHYDRAIDCYKVINHEFKIHNSFKTWLDLNPGQPELLLKQAEYFEAIGLFEKAKKSYHHAFSFSQDQEFKIMIQTKIVKLLQEPAASVQVFMAKAATQDLYNYDLVNDEFVNHLLGTDEALSELG